MTFRNGFFVTLRNNEAADEGHTRASVINR